MAGCPGFLGVEGRVLGSEDVRAYEINSVYRGVPLSLLMENAGRSVADFVECVLGGVGGRRIVVLAGKGGNGGDGIVAARHLHLRGAAVEVHLTHAPESFTRGDSRMMLEAISRGGGPRILAPGSRGWMETGNADAVIDAILGVGARGEPRGAVADAIRAYNSSPGLRVSVDVPSGVDPDTGEAPGVAARSDYTVAMQWAKPGLLAPPGSLYAGEVVVAEIGFPPKSWEYSGPGDYAARIPERPRDSWKGRGGRVLVVGGSRRYVGAPIMASLAAYRAGADLVYLASPFSAEAASRWPVIVPRGLDEVREAAERAHSIVVGPGMGVDDESRRLLGEVLEASRGKPVVIDADALKIIAESGESLWEEAVLTPHRGEARLLSGGLGDHVEAARRIASRYGATVAVKAPVDVACSPRGECRFNDTGSPSMSVGGTGDVLAGVVAAFLARRAALGLPPRPLHTAIAGLYITGRAGEIAVERLGGNITAMDLIESLGDAMREARSAT